MSPSQPRSSRIAAAAVICGLLLSATLAGNLYGRGAVLIVLACGALLGAISLFWHSLQSLTGDAPLTLEEAISLGAPSAEEERKQSVLRILKDLEYERAVGKLSEQDYQVLSQGYRAEAKALLSILDENLAPARERAERLLTERLKAARPGTSGVDDRTTVDAAQEPSAGADDATRPPEPADMNDDQHETAAFQGKGAVDGDLPAESAEQSDTAGNNAKLSDASHNDAKQETKQGATEA